MRFRIFFWIIVVLLCTGMAVVATTAYRNHKRHDAIEAKLASIVSPRPQDVTDCSHFRRQRPLMLLVLGQSNAGNHGSLSSSEQHGTPVMLLYGKTCVLAADPLPGATGAGGSIWPHLPALLSKGLADRPVMLSILAVDATSIADWTTPDSPLLDRMHLQIQMLHGHGFSPDFVLWQQGEADARLDTSASDYQAALTKLATLLSKAGVTAPILLARSTVCRSPSSPSIRSAIDQTVKGSAQFLPGPDLDTLISPSLRMDGCHFNAAGLKVAAKAWATHILTAANSSRR